MGPLAKLAADHELSLTQLRMIGILHDRKLTISELARPSVGGRHVRNRRPLIRGWRSG